MTQERAPVGVTLHVEGAPVERVRYVIAGTVGLWRGDDEARGAGIPWQLRRAGTLLGAEGLTEDHHTDTAITLTEVTTCAATRACFKRWAMEESLEAARAVMTLLVRAQCDDQPRASSVDGTATRRVARWLADETRGGVAPMIPRAVVAGLLGMAPETLSRSLAKLAERGAISLCRKEIRVIDAEALLREAAV